MIFGESISIEDNDTDNLTPPLPCLLFKGLWLSTFIMGTSPVFWRRLPIPHLRLRPCFEFSRAHFPPSAVPFSWIGSANTTRRHGSTPLASPHPVGPLFCCGPSNTWRRFSLKSPHHTTAGGLARLHHQVRLARQPHRPASPGAPHLSLLLPLRSEPHIWQQLPS